MTYDYIPLVNQIRLLMPLTYKERYACSACGARGHNSRGCAILREVRKTAKREKVPLWERAAKSFGRSIDTT